MKRTIAVALVLVLVVAAIGVAWLVWQRRAQATHAPVRTADALPNSSRTSSITLPIVVKVKDIEARLNESVPTTLQTIDEDVDGCFAPRLGRLAPRIDCRLDGAVTRGAIDVDGDGQVLRVTMPVKIQVAARGRGEIGKLFRETADGRLTVRASVRADIAADWTPSVNVVTEYEWDEPIGIDVFGVRITFASTVDAAVKKALQSIEREIPRHLRELKLEQRAQEGWRRAHAVVAMDEGVWLRFVPTSVAFGGYDVASGQLHATVNVTGHAETYVGSAAPASPAPKPLPRLARGVTGSGFAFDMPVFLDYAALELAAEKELKLGTKQHVDVPGTGQVAIVVKDVTLFQTAGQKLAVGIAMDADAPGVGLDATGTVWFTATPVVDDKKKRIEVKDLVVYSQTDNTPLDVFVSTVALDSVTSAVRAAVTFDYAREHAQAITRANDALKHRELSSGVHLDAKITKGTLTTIAAGPTGLRATLLVEGAGELTADMHGR